MARKTVLVCDSCGKEVDEGKGRRAARDLSPTRGAGRSRPISATTAREHAGHACGSPRPAAEGASDRVRERLLARRARTACQEPSGPRSRMDRWVSASSPGPPTRAKWRFCSSAIWRRSRASRFSSSRTGRTSSGSSVTCSRAAERSSAARSGPSTTSSSGSPTPAPSSRSLLGDAQRTLLVRRIVGGASLNGLGRSARFAGFADSLAATFAELESGLLDPSAIEGDLARLYAAYCAELDRLGRWDRDALRRHAVDRLQSEFDSWSGQPVFAYGFEDLTGAEWELLRALAGRTDVTVSLPFEAGRTAFDSLRPTMDDLSALADGRIEVCRRASTTSRIRRSRTSSGDCSSTRRAGAGGDRRRRSLLRGRGHARDARARRPRDPRARARGHARRSRSRSSARRSSAGAHRSRPASARSASPSPSRPGRD